MWRKGGEPTVASFRYVMRSFLSLSFFKPAKAIFVPGMYLWCMSCQRKGGPCHTNVRTFLGFSRYSNSVCSSHITPLLTFAAVYEKPSLWPDLRPKILNYNVSFCKAHRCVYGYITHANLVRLCWARLHQQYGIARTVSWKEKRP